MTYLYKLIFLSATLLLFANYAKAVPCECENKDGKTDCSKCFQEASDRILPQELKKELNPEYFEAQPPVIRPEELTEYFRNKNKPKEKAPLAPLVTE
jgi:hypothetical protein